MRTRMRSTNSMSGNGGSAATGGAAAAGAANRAGGNVAAPGGSRRETWCPTDARRAPLALLDATHGPIDADTDNDADDAPDTAAEQQRVGSSLQRVHDGDTVDLGVVMRSALVEADRATAASAAAPKPPTTTTTTTTARTRESELQLWMLPQKVANEIVALRKELADATARLDDAANATRIAESKLAQALHNLLCAVVDIVATNVRCLFTLCVCACVCACAELRQRRRRRQRPINEQRHWRSLNALPPTLSHSATPLAPNLKRYRASFPVTQHCLHKLSRDILCRSDRSAASSS